MTQFYSDTRRESEPHALPDMEVFFLHSGEFLYAHEDSWCADVFKEAVMESWADESTDAAEADAAKTLQGYYYWSCFPGCMPDGEPNGPFDSEEAAMDDARDG